MSKYKILTVTTSGLVKKEGISTVILDYYSFFDREKYQLDLIAAGECRDELVGEFESIGVRVQKLPGRKTELARYISALMKLMKREKYDAIYIHGSSAIMSIELCIARACGCKTRVVHSHNTMCEHQKVDQLLRPIFYRNYTTALACGTDAGKWLYGDRKFDVIKNGRDVEKYKFNAQKRAEIRQKLGLEEHTLAIGHVGAFFRQKNQGFLIDVLEKVIPQRPDVKLFLMGEGENREPLMERVEAEGLLDSVYFTGSISNVAEMLQAMDVMVLPSIYEGVPLVAIEWQIAGLPCLISDRVSHECAYMDSVEFLPLEADLWAMKLTTFTPAARIENDPEILQRTKDHGYSLRENAGKLQEYFQ